ncbi:MAG: DUF3772 domain-containing protein [Pseudomonadota bacterium]
MLDRLLSLVRLLALALVLTTGAAQAQDDQTFREMSDTWARNASVGETAVLQGATTQALEQIRARLVADRAEALAVRREAESWLETLLAQREALGEPPGEGQSEPPEIAERRATLNDQIAEAEVPALTAAEAMRRAENLIGRIDSLIRGRFSEQLVTLGPSPLVPARWVGALEETVETMVRIRNETANILSDPAARADRLMRLPALIGLVLAGLALAIWIRRALVRWFYSFQAEGRGGSIVALVTFARLLLPLAGAWLIFFAMVELEIVGARGGQVLDAIPLALVALIGAQWLAVTLYTPRTPTTAILKVEEGLARPAARTTRLLGFLTALDILIFPRSGVSSLSEETLAVVNLPIAVVGGILLYRLSRCLRPVPLPPPAEDEEPQPESLRRVVRRFAARISVILAVVIPVAALAGYLALSQFLLMPWLLTLALVGSLLVIFEMIRATVDALIAGDGDEGEEEAAQATGDRQRLRIAPIFVGFLLVLVAVPLLALIWGARPSDLQDAWTWVIEGVDIGETRLSLGDALSFVVIFGIGYTLTRVLQGVLRNAVLPETRLDAGGRNAVVAGIGYVGIFLAAVIAISSTGLDLSNLAIVAGALSVGVGFGLQTIVSNFVSGIILLIERPVKEGDWVEVAGFTGYVQKISVRSTRIETFDRASVIVPNQELIAGTVLNWTHQNITGRLVVPVGVAYGTDVEQVREILTGIAERHHMVLRRPEPAVLFMGFGASSLDFEIRCFLRDVNWKLFVLSEMNFQIYAAFAEAGIEIPFAQRDVTLRNAEQAAEALAKGLTGLAAPDGAVSDRQALGQNGA